MYNIVILCQKFWLFLSLDKHEFNRPIASWRFWGRSGFSVFHGQVTWYHSSSNFSVFLNVSITTLSSFTFGLSVTPMDSIFQKSSSSGLVETASSVLVNTCVPIFVPNVRTNKLVSYMVSSNSAVWPVSIHPNYELRKYKPFCTSILCGRTTSK